MNAHRTSAFLILSLLASFTGTVLINAADDYKLGPDSIVQDGVPRGQVTKHSWSGKIFPGTVRDYWVYVPAQYDATKPACVMVFQDGGSYVSTNGQLPCRLSKSPAPSCKKTRIGCFAPLRINAG